MRVLYWTQLYWPYIGGVEVHGANFLRAMQTRGYEFAVVTSHGSLNLPDEDEFEGVPIHRFPFRTALAEGNMDQLKIARQRLIQLKQAFKPDLIHIQLSDPSAFFHLQTAAAHPAPTLISVHIALPVSSSGNDTLLGKLLTSADWVTANSEAVLNDVRQLVPDIVSGSSFIYCSLELPDLSPEPLPFHPPQLLSLGRLVIDKGFDLTIDAFSKLIKHYLGIRLVIAGDGPARSTLEQQARSLSISHAVEFCGWVKPVEVSNLINTSTVVIVPSRCQEALGLVALQAAQMARPVVATRVGGLPEVVADHETGLVVEKEKPQALAGAIAFLLDHPGEAVRMGKQARIRAHEKFGWKHHLDAYDKLYQRLLHGAHVEFK